MKSVFAFALVSVFCSAAFADQQAFVNRQAMTRQQSHTVLAATLTSFNVDRREEFGMVQSGSIVIDVATRSATLTLQPRFFCPAGRVCAQVMPAPVVITLPLIGRQMDRCGSIHYTAGQDLRRVDGALQNLTVSDNTGNRCPHLVAMNETDVVLRVVPARFSLNEERVSTFSANKLRQTLVAVPFNGQPVFAQ